MENVLAEAADILLASGRVFTYGTQVAMEADWQDGTGQRLVPLRTGGKVEGGAENWLANVMMGEEFIQGQVVQFAPPRPLIDILLRSEPALARLPRIRQYARTPLYDEHFVLRGPGWHPSAGVLIHGPAVEPTPFSPADTALPVLDRLPRHLRTLLADFCFAGPADVANALAMFLTGMLVNHFIVPTKPMGILDGNQPNVGKTLLARAVGMVLGGTDPRLIGYTTDDDELAKRLCATLREEQSRVVIIDNAKVKGGGAIDSPTLEANSMAPTISLRILGQSLNYTGPNDVLFFITMNNTKTSPDLVSRALPIRLAYEGDPKRRRFSGPGPIEYAREHRATILGELAGLVDNWVLRGRPEGAHGHRCNYWAKVVGGIMTAAGFPEFLANAEEAAVEFNAALDSLVALAEVAAASNGPHAVPVDTADAASETRGALAKDWVPVFIKAGVLAEELGTGSKQSRGTRIGKYFKPLVGREVSVEASGRVGLATLCTAGGRSREQRYYFAIRWDRPPETAPNPPNYEVAPPANGEVHEAPTCQQSAPAAPTPVANETQPATTNGNAENWD